AIGDRRGLLLLIVFVEALHRPLDAEMREQLARVAGVLAQDEVRRLERLDAARRKVGQVADGRTDDQQLAGHSWNGIWSVAVMLPFQSVGRGGMAAALQ